MDQQVDGEPPQRTIWRVAGLGDYPEYPKSEEPESLERVGPETLTELVVSSEMTNGMHRPVLDLDVPAQLVASSTPGHFHLFIERDMPWSDYQPLLWALAKAGVIEPRYYEHSVRRGRTAVRLPTFGKV